MNHAIVAAVSRYPRWPESNLDGPLHDLVDFGRWLLDPNGGNIAPAAAPEFAAWVADPASAHAPLSAAPASAVQFFVSPGLAQPLTALDPVPITSKIEEALQRVHFQGIGARDGRGRPRVGERLFLYFAGHGFAPNERDAALFMADSAPTATGLHIIGGEYARHFLRGNFFDEVMLVMDCCRVDGSTVPKRIPPFDPFGGPDAPLPSEPFVAFATSFDQTSRETVHEGAVRGVFTRLLLEGLRGAAMRQEDGGKVTARGLEHWLRDRLQPLNQRPVIEFDRNVAEHVLARLPIKPPNLRIRALGGGADVVEVRGGPAVVQPTRRVGAVWEFTLDPGIYIASIAGTNRQLIIRETMLGGPDVDL